MRRVVQSGSAVFDVQQRRRLPVVIGAGITGAFAAYFLARRGLKPLLIERAGVGTGASGNNPGGLNTLHGPGIPGPLSDLAWHSFLLHLHPAGDLVRAGGPGAAVRRVRRLEIALDAIEADALGPDLERSRQADGFAARWLDAGVLRRLEPRVSPEAVGALWTEGNGMVDCRTYTGAIARAALASLWQLRIALVRNRVRNWPCGGCPLDWLGIGMRGSGDRDRAHSEGPQLSASRFPFATGKCHLLGAWGRAARILHDGVSGVIKLSNAVGGRHTGTRRVVRRPIREGRRSCCGKPGDSFPSVSPHHREHVARFVLCRPPACRSSDGPLAGRTWRSRPERAPRVCCSVLAWASARPTW